MPRRTGEQTRELLIDVGMQMLLERGAAAGVQHIRLQDVLRRAGLTTGAAYRLWADQTDFQRDLAVAMVGLRFHSPVQPAAAAAQQLIAAGEPLDEIIRGAATTHVLDAARRQAEPDSRDARAFLIALALRATASTWPELLTASRARHTESIEVFAEFYDRLMTAYGYRLRRPFTIIDFTEAMAALGEGFAIRALEGLDHPVLTITDDDEGPPGEWTLFGLAIRGLVAAFMIKDDQPAAANREDADGPGGG